MIRITADPKTRQELRKSLAWAVLLGILMIAAGVLACLEPFAAAIAITLFVGFIFFLYGILHVIYAFSTRELGAGWFVLQVLLGLLYLVAGGVLLKQPFEGMLTLTLIVGILILIDGVINAIHAFDMRPTEGWGWVLFSGITGIVVGMPIWSGWPQISEWLLGMLIGIKLMIGGLAVLMMSTAIRRSIVSDSPSETTPLQSA